MNERLSPDDREAIECVAPATSEVIGRVPVTGAADVKRAVERARAAQKSWGALPVRDRVRQLRPFRARLLRAQDELTDLLALECGKPRQEGRLIELFALLALAGRCLRRAPHVLEPVEVPLDLFKHRRSRVHYQPRGVIGIISPWNFPLLIPFGDAFAAWVSGNATVIKPSEHASLIALRVKELWDESGLDPDLLQVVTGRAETGQALIQSGIQKLVFTGGVATGRHVAAACGRELVECVMELGGKAPAIVCDDANLALAAEAIVFGGFINAGQACVSVERVLAHQAVHDELVSEIVQRASRLRLGGPEGDWDVGPVIFPPQIEIVESLLQEAVAQGARILVGGKKAARPGNFFEPTVVVDCHPDMRIMKEELFGPVVPVAKVRDDEHALQIANGIELGLNAYVFSKSAPRARALAERLEVGSVAINDVITDYGSPEVPFGGVKNSGFGRVHGDDSLRSMCHVKHVGEGRLPPLRAFWYPYSERGDRLGRKLLHALFSESSPLSKLVGKV